MFNTDLLNKAAANLEGLVKYSNEKELKDDKAHEELKQLLVTTNQLLQTLIDMLGKKGVIERAS